MIYHWWGEPWLPGWGSVWLVSLLQHYSLSLFPNSTVYKEVIMHILHLRSGQLCSTGLREYLHKLFGILLYKRFVYSPLIYLFNHLLISVWICWYLFYTSNYNPMIILLLKLFQIWPLEALSFGSYIPLTYLYNCRGFLFLCLFRFL